MQWIEQQQGTISYMPWTWNTWGALQRMGQAVGNTTQAARSGSGGEALVKDYSGAPTAWGAAVKASFEKASVGVPFV